MVPRIPARTRPTLRITRRTSRGMIPIAAMPLPDVKPRPSDFARV